MVLILSYECGMELGLCSFIVWSEVLEWVLLCIELDEIRSFWVGRNVEIRFGSILFLLSWEVLLLQINCGDWQMMKCGDGEGRKGMHSKHLGFSWTRTLPLTHTANIKKCRLWDFPTANKCHYMTSKQKCQADKSIKRMLSLKSSRKVLYSI